MVRFVWLAGIALCTAWETGPAAAGPRGDQPDEQPSNDDSAADGGRLYGETAELVEALSQKGMPELVEALLLDANPACRIHVARAYLRAALAEPIGPQRDRFMQAAEAEYRRLLTGGPAEEPGDGVTGGASAAAARGEWATFHQAQSRIELADLLLRQRLAGELDRFEMTSGLAFNRARLVSGLEEVGALYRGAGESIGALRRRQRGAEERFMLLGLTGALGDMEKSQRTGAAWAGLYYGMVLEPTDGRRGAALAEALAAFDALESSAGDSPERLAAMVGRGIALREVGEFRDGEAAFERVLAAASPPALAARARHEQVRLMISAGRFEDARAVLNRQEQTPIVRFRGDEETGAFYVRLAPLMRAWTTICELRSAAQGVAKDSRRDAARAEALRRRAVEELERAARQGSEWEALVRVYLARIRPADARAADMTGGELRLLADEYLSRGEFARAAELLEEFLRRDQTGDADTAAPVRAEAKFNLAVCRFQQGRLSEAGVLFGESADSAAGALAERAAEHAYRVARQIAVESKSPADCRSLVVAATRLADRFPRHAQADEARWAAAVAMQEAGELEDAVAAYERIGESSAHHMQAQSGVAACRQRQFDQTPAADAARRQAAGRAAADAWLAYARVAETAGGDAADGDGAAEARVHAARLLAGPPLNEQAAALVALGDLAGGHEVLALRWQCQWRLGRAGDASDTLTTLLATPGDDRSAAALLELLQLLRSEVDRLLAAGQTAASRGLARDAARIAERTCGLASSGLLTEATLAEARFAWAAFLADAGDEAEALAQLERLLQASPDSGRYLSLAAEMSERLAERGRAAASAESTRLGDRAEALWSRLLEDSSLRESRPEVYWKARYFWLRHQLRRGLASAVAQGIQTERAWYPDLGGPPWQARLLDLHEQASRQTAGERGEPAKMPSSGAVDPPSPQELP